MDVKIEPNWKAALSEEFTKHYFTQLAMKLKSDRAAGMTIYPPGPQIFNAYEKTPPSSVKVVIIGQDPYHGPGQAMGLSFSVPKGIAVPASLKNIYKELNTDVGALPVDHGDLTHWADQGVFLLNAVLTVQHKQAGSHRTYGWQHFTDATIAYLDREMDHLVFMLWGNYAKGKKEIITNPSHLVLTAAHPSPLARGAYFGSGHFSKANHFLTQHGKQPIDWQLPRNNV